ncbi:MAG: immunoglobulin-like domain-containing protein [Bacilli bacterium]
MKKIVLLFALMLLFFVTGCQNTVPEENSNVDVVNTIASWVPTQIPEATLEDITLPTTHPQLGGTIVWTSYDEEVMNNQGEVLSTTSGKDVMLEFRVTYEDQSKSDFVFIKVAGIALDEVAGDFTKQFMAIIARDYEVKTEFSDGYVVTWTSSNPEMFSNEGIFTRPNDDTTIQINFTVSFGDFSENFTHEVLVQGLLHSVKVAEIRTWITNNYLPERLVSEEVTLPTEYSKYRATISWNSSNYNVIDNNGTITRYGFDRYITLTARIEIDDQFSETDFSLVVAKKDITSQQEKIDSFLEAIAVEEMPKITWEYYTNISQSYNMMPFFDGFDTPIVEQIAPSTVYARPGTKLYSVEFITIHDTAGTSSTATAQAHANLIDSGYSASWHFAVDEDGAYNSIPLDEVAYHAGDGSRPFNLTDTGVTATVKYPVLTITDDGYFAFNGEKSGVRAPMTGDSTYAKTYQITPSGIYNEIGSNGHYYINTAYYNTSYGKVSNGGGNRNSIGFETCVNTGSNYTKTFRHAANITADLLVQHDLSVDRIMQHNNFSGKDCPLTIRRTDYWNNFLDLVSLLKYGKENFQNYSFVWTSQSSTLQANGLIDRAAEPGSHISYSVVVTNLTNPLDVYNQSYTTLLK